MFLGELQHGTYNDECDGLTLEEVNSFYDFGEDGEPQFDNDEDPDQLDEEREEDSGDNYEEGEVDMELDEPGSRDVIDPDHDFDMEVHHSSIPLT